MVDNKYDVVFVAAAELSEPAVYLLYKCLLFLQKENIHES
jgi:hypothetical protein